MNLDEDRAQEYIFNLPEGVEYGLEVIAENGKFMHSTTYVKFGEERANYFAAPKFFELEYVFAEYQSTEGTCRVVKYSRYLVNNKPVVHKILYYKEIR